MPTRTIPGQRRDKQLRLVESFKHRAVEHRSNADRHINTALQDLQDKAQ